MPGYNSKASSINWCIYHFQYQRLPKVQLRQLKDHSICHICTLIFPPNLKAHPSWWGIARRHPPYLHDTYGDAGIPNRWVRAANHGGIHTYGGTTWHQTMMPQEWLLWLKSLVYISDIHTFWGILGDFWKFPINKLLVGGWSNPSEKYAQVKFDHLTRVRGKNKNVWNHHQDYYGQ